MVDRMDGDGGERDPCGCIREEDERASMTLFVARKFKVKPYFAAGSWAEARVCKAEETWLNLRCLLRWP